MHAAYCTGAGSIELRDVPSPEPGAGQVLVRVHACGICGSDLHYYAGAEPPPAVCLGHEIAGRVATAGGGFAVGEMVVVEPLLSCGACARCLAGEPNLCPALRILGSLAPGGLAELVAVPASALFRVPPDLDLDAAMLAEPLAVGIHAAHLGEVESGDRVLVLGAGAIGLLAAFAAGARGARVTVSARHPHQAEAARALGAIDIVGTTREEVLARCAQAPPDIVLETVGGTAATLDLALRAVRPGGRIVALGKFTRPITLPPLRFLMKEARLVSSMTYCRRAPRTDFAHALDLLARERTRLAALITRRVSLTEVARGFAVAADKASGTIKVAVAP
jgi:(R,R)-butanediol dehydrogenase/meso-butanediol dehydrogenase/diacetyl reductase